MQHKSLPKRSMNPFLISLITILTFTGSGICAATKPNPDGFNLDPLPNPPKRHSGGLYLNLTEHPYNASDPLMQSGELAIYEDDPVVAIATVFGIAWQVFDFAVGVTGAVQATKSCINNDGSASNILDCVFGLAATVCGIGNGFIDLHEKGWLARGSSTFNSAGLEDVELNAFGGGASASASASAAARQAWHETAMRHALRAHAINEPEFLGYANGTHRLARRSAGDRHALAPTFRILSAEHGYLDVTSRGHADATRLTVEYAGAGLDRRQSFRHERFGDDHVMEARFDCGARRADPRLRFHPKKGYPTIKQEIDCFRKGKGGKNWRGNHVMSFQGMQSDPNLTFSFASIGIFKKHDKNAKHHLKQFKPKNMPLAVPNNC